LGFSFFTARGPEALNEKMCAKGFARRGWPDADWKAIYPVEFASREQPPRAGPGFGEV